MPPLFAGLGVATHTSFDPLDPTPLGWLTDIAVTFAAVWLIVALAALGVAAIGRRPAAGLLALAALLVLAVTLLESPRAERTASPSGPVVRVLVLNALSVSTRGSDQLDMILDAGADIVMLNEPSASLLDAVRSDPRAASAFPYTRLPGTAGPGYRFVLSKHPLSVGHEGFGFVWPEIEEALGYHGARVARVTLPQGPFVFVGVQFRSPRSPERWSAGNKQALDTAQGVRLIAERTRLPVIVAGDINATPVGVRSREFARVSGLVRAKPALRADGTYPASLPWPLRVPIDGAMVSPGVRLVSYRSLAAPGSDHLAVLMELELPSQRVDRRADDAAGER